MIKDKFTTPSNISSDKSLNLFRLFSSLIVSSSIVVFVTTSLMGITSLLALKISYITILTSLAFIVILIGKGLQIQDMMLKFFPIFIPIFVSIGYIIYLLFNYGDRISENKVSDYYSTFMNLTNTLLGIQIGLLLSQITIKSFDFFDLTPKILSILKLLSVLTIVSGITLGIILKYYNTDG
jgi:hypothetical protein